jgi:flagellar biosynthesis regulator FlbT
MLMNPTDSFAAREMFKKSIQMTIEVSENALLVAGLRSVKG